MTSPVLRKMEAVRECRVTMEEAIKAAATDLIHKMPG